MGVEAVQLQHFGAEITGLDLSEPIPAAVQKQLYELWLQHGILLFRGIGTSGDRHVRLARCFGPLQEHPVERIRMKDNPDLIVLATEDPTIPVQYVNGEARSSFIYWHSDMSYVPDINKGALLRLVEVPPLGGETSWTDTAAAFDDLPREMKERLAHLSTIQACRNAVPRPWGQPDLSLRTAPTEEFALPHDPQGDFPLVLQPMVITHPESGIRSLLLSPLGYVRIEGLEQDESDRLFEQLCRHALQEKYRYTHHWQKDDMVLWDNRRTMHCAWGCPVGMRRTAQRATLAEVQPTGRLYGANR